MHFLNKGDKELGHTHPFDHITLLAKGSVQITVCGKKSSFQAPKMIFIKAEEMHELVALEDNTVAFCIHPLRDGDGVGDIIDPDSVPLGVDILSVARPVVGA